TKRFDADVDSELVPMLKAIRDSPRRGRDGDFGSAERMAGHPHGLECVDTRPDDPDRWPLDFGNACLSGELDPHFVGLLSSNVMKLEGADQDDDGSGGA